MLFNHTIFLSYLGALFSWAFTVVIIFIKKQAERNNRREVLLNIKKYSPEEIGDIDEKLNNDGFKVPDIFQIITMWGVQPLFILCFLNFFTLPKDGVGFINCILIIITILHEFYWADKLSDKWYYQLLIIVLWASTFMINNYLANRMNPVNYTTKSGTSNEIFSKQTIDSL